jgi:hypothetical protein
MGAAFSFLQRLRQLRTLRTARIIHVVCNLLRAFGCQFIEPIDDLAITATVSNEAGEDIAAIPPAFLTSDAQHSEFAGEVAEDDCQSRNIEMPRDGVIISGCVG